MRLSERVVALVCFLCLVVPLTVYCAWRVPLGQVPDEPNHAARIDSLLHGQLIGYRVKTLNLTSGATDAGVTANAGLVLAINAGNGAEAPLPPSASPQARLAWAKAIPWAPAASFISCVNTAAYAPIAYIPAALALGVAIAEGAPPHAAAIAARFGNVIVFAILGCLSLLLARRGRTLLFVTLSLPITIWLAGSCSQDGVLIAAATLAFALFTRRSTAGFWAGTVLLAVLALQKPPFVTLMLVPFLAPASAAERWPQRLSGALLVTIPAALWSILVMRHVSVPLLPSGPYHPGPLWPGDPNRIFRSAIAPAQISVMLHHPLTVALLPLTVGIKGLVSFLTQVIGVLANNNLRLPRQLYMVFGLALISAAGALLTTAPRIGANRWAFPLLLIAALGCIELIFLVEYMTWTPVGATHIDGVQGRYFVPLLPLLTLLLGRILPIPERFGWIWWICPLVAIVTLDFSLKGVIIEHYYYH